MICVSALNVISTVRKYRSPKKEFLGYSYYVPRAYRPGIRNLSIEKSSFPNNCKHVKLDQCPPIGSGLGSE